MYSGHTSHKLSLFTNSSIFCLSSLSCGDNFLDCVIQSSRWFSSSACAADTLPEVVRAVVRGDKITGTEAQNSLSSSSFWRHDHTVCVFRRHQVRQSDRQPRAIKGRHEPLHLAFYTWQNFEKVPGTPIPRRRPWHAALNLSHLHTSASDIYNVLF